MGPYASPARGVRYGRLVVLRLEQSRRGRRVWRCLCDCGRHKLVETRLLTRAETRSCGCLHADVARAVLAGRMVVA